MVRVDIPDEDLRPDMMREALGGRVPRVPPSAALALISELDISLTDQQALLQEAVQDPDLEPHVRVAAVRAYMRLGAETAVPGLLEALESSEQRVAGAAAGAIGQLGEPEHLPLLQRMRERVAGELPRRRAAFAEALIVHRFGVTDHDVELPAVDTQPAPLAVGALSFGSARPGRDRRARALSGIKQELPWLDTAKQDVYELQCGPRLIEIAVDRDFVGPDGVKALAQRRALPAVVAFQDVEYDEFNPGLVVLSRPNGKDGVTLLLTRLNGEPVYTGEGSVNRDEPEFELRSVQTPGIVSVIARVRFTARGVEITVVSDRYAAPAQSPERIEPSAT